MPFALAGLDLLKVERVVLYGGELVVKERAGGPEVSLLFDIETAISADFKLGGTTILKIPEDSPIVVRYKAIGLRLGYTPPEPRFAFRPVFDASKGYTVDVSKPRAIQAWDRSARSCRCSPPGWPAPTRSPWTSTWA